MSTQQSLANDQRFHQTGVCSCGKNMTEHVAFAEPDKLTEALRASPIACKLTQEDVIRWHTPPQQVGMPGR